MRRDCENLGEETSAERPNAVGVGEAEQDVVAVDAEQIRHADDLGGAGNRLELHHAVSTGELAVAVLEDVGGLGRSVVVEGGPDLCDRREKDSRRLRSPTRRDS